MDPCILTKTGFNFLPIVLLVAILAISLSSLIFYKKPKMMLFMLALVFSFNLGLPAIASAQALPEECSPTGAESTDENGVTLGLADDIGLIQIPDIDTDSTTSYVSILGNDTPPEDDPYDWETIDIDLDTAGQQTDITLPHPDDASMLCGYVSVRNFGVLEIGLQYECFDSDWINSLTIPSDYTIPSFQYTVSTLNGEPAPEAATVTINTQANPVNAAVDALDDFFSLCVTDNPSGLAILANDTANTGTIDVSSVDLDVSKPGQQTSVTINNLGDIYTVSVNSAGELSIIAPPTAGVYDFLEGFYTVKNSDGQISNIAQYDIHCPGSL